MDAENVDIKVWAQQIREMKIRELQVLIDKAEKAEAFKLYEKLEILTKNK